MSVMPLEISQPCTFVKEKVGLYQCAVCVCVHASLFSFWINLLIFTKTGMALMPLETFQPCAFYFLTFSNNVVDA
jgi:hypothetical protein